MKQGGALDRTYLVLHTLCTSTIAQYAIDQSISFYNRLIVQKRKKEDDTDERDLKEELKEMRALLELLLKKSENLQNCSK